MSQEITRRGASVAPPSPIGALPLLSVLFLLFFAGVIGAGYLYQDYAKNRKDEGVSDADVKAALARVDAAPIKLKVVPKLPSYEFPPIGGPVPDGPLWEITERVRVKPHFLTTNGLHIRPVLNYKLRKVSLKEARGKWLVLFFNNNAVWDEDSKDPSPYAKRLMHPKFYNDALAQVVKVLYDQGVPVEMWHVQSFMSAGKDAVTPDKFAFDKWGVEVPWSRGIHGAAVKGSDGNWTTDLKKWQLKNLALPFADHYTPELPLEDGDRKFRLKRLLERTSPLEFAILDPQGRLRFMPDWYAYCQVPQLNWEEDKQHRWEVRARCADLSRLNADLSTLGIVVNVLYQLTGQKVPEDMGTAFDRHPLADMEIPEIEVGGIKQSVAYYCSEIMEHGSVDTVRWQNRSYNPLPMPKEKYTPSQCRNIIARWKEAELRMSEVEGHELNQQADRRAWKNSGELGDWVRLDFSPNLGVKPSTSRLPIEVQMMRRWGDFQKELLGQLAH